MPGVALGTGDTEKNKIDKNRCSNGAYILIGQRTRKMVSKLVKRIKEKKNKAGKQDMKCSWVRPQLLKF